MPRKFFRKYLPDPARLREHRHLRVFGQWLSDPNLWHLNRRSIATGMFIGLLCALLPIPQMLPAALLAILFRANLPLSVALVWLTNPLTAVPIWYGAYELGSWMLNTPPLLGLEEVSGEALWNTAVSNVGQVYVPLLLGSTVIGLLLAISGWLGVHYVWRLHVRHQWRLRRERRAARRDDDAAP